MFVLLSVECDVKGEVADPVDVVTQLTGWSHKTSQTLLLPARAEAVTPLRMSHLHGMDLLLPTHY